MENYYNIFQFNWSYEFVQDIFKRIYLFLSLMLYTFTN